MSDHAHGEWTHKLEINRHAGVESKNGSYLKHSALGKDWPHLTFTPKRLPQGSELETGAISGFNLAQQVAVRGPSGWLEQVLCYWLVRVLTLCIAILISNVPVLPSMDILSSL